MKFAEIFRFELAYQARRASTWIIFAVVIAFAFLNTGDDSVAEALYEDFFLNSPFAIAKTTVIGTFMWLMVAAVVAGGAAARDVATRMHPLTYTAPVTKAQYLGGRFLAAFLLNALLLLGVQAGILLAVYWPGVNPAAIGPFGPAAYLTAYAFISLPNAFAGTAIQFWLAARSGRPMASYLGSFLLFFLGFFVASLLLYYRGFGTLVDPIGIRFIIEDLAHLWTPTEKKWRLLALEGTVLQNRLVWLGVGMSALAVTYTRFGFGHRMETSGWWRRLERRREAPVPPSHVTQVSTRWRRLGHPTLPALPARVWVRQALAVAWASFRMIVLSRIGLAMLAVIPLLALVAVLDQLMSAGVPRIPTTALVLSELTAPLTAVMSRWVIIPLLLLFCAGELVWRERDAGLGELTDAMPASEWPQLLGKFLAIGFVTAVFMALLAAGGMLAQMYLGYHDFERGLYLKILFGLQVPEYLLFALLAVVIHVLVNQKYLGHLAAMVVYAFIVMPALFGVEHNLLVYGGGPTWTYTEMRGFGATFGPWLWFKAYWAAWAMLLAVVARLLWVRGRDTDLRARIRLARRRFTRPTVRTAAVAVALVLTLGGFIFYNTNVLNDYFTEAEYQALLAGYERRYGRYEGIPQPRLAATRLNVEIHPERRAVDIAGTYDLVNRSAVAIGTVHVALIPGAETRAISFDRAAAAVVTDDVRGHRIYALAKPLQPGELLRLRFQVHVEPRGFSNHGIRESVVANGSFFTNADWLPAIGYQPLRELTSPSDRRKQGLPPRPLISSLRDTEARMTATERTTFEAFIGTDEDQIAVAPGALRRTWTEGPRRYFHYATDGPIGNDYTFFSARYAVREARWGNTAIRIFHHPTHTVNLERMARSARAALDLYTKQFGPYPHRHLTFVEVRGNELGMHADPTLIRFSEEMALLNPGNGPRSHDLPFEVVAHEVAHQWWGHQLEPAFVEGGPVIGEGLAVYSAMGVVEATGGREQLRRLLTFMRQPFPYAPIRRGEPLLRGVDPYLAYRRGPFALHALSESIGRDRVDAALRRLLETHPPGQVPLVTMLDLYRELQAVTPASLHPLLHDLFEVNTFWDFRTERATAKQTAAGTWEVKLDVKASKVVVDHAGVETVVPMDELVEIGIFAPGQKGQGELSAPLHLQKHRIRSGMQTLTVTVPAKPVLAGIDPHHLLDWVEAEDDENIDRVAVVK
ncbi:MAG TPA: hypothetical protein VGF69_07875 [Thermoanaerobaculia bacterium]|jgi:ABC-type transport system involved in multi-copper enzyme maturation permease subunit